MAEKPESEKCPAFPDSYISGQWFANTQFISCSWKLDLFLIQEENAEEIIELTSYESLLRFSCFSDKLLKICNIVCSQE